MACLPISIHLVWMNVGDKLFYLYRNANTLKTSERTLRGELFRARSIITIYECQRNEAVNECTALKEQLGALEGVYQAAVNEHVAECTVLKEQLGALESAHQAALS